MPPNIEVKTSGHAIGHAPEVLVTRGIGSCIAICLYDKQRKIGALLHIMLPRSEGHQLDPYRFADTALSHILVELQTENISKESLTAKLIGGAQMFKAFSYNNIGDANITEVRRLLNALGIPIESQDVGGSAARSLEFDLESGNITIYAIANSQLLDKTEPAI